MDIVNDSAAVCPGFNEEAGGSGSEEDPRGGGTGANSSCSI